MSVNAVSSLVTSAPSEFEVKLTKREEKLTKLCHEILGYVPSSIMLNISRVMIEELSQNERPDILKFDSPYASLSPSGKYIVSLPFAFLLKKKDFEEGSSVHPILSQAETDIRSQEDPRNKYQLIALEHLRNLTPAEFKLVKKFIMCHELAHILLGHTDEAAKSQNELHQRELDADRLAVQLVGTNEGAKITFQIYIKYYPNISSVTHPSWEKRLENISK